MMTLADLQMTIHSVSRNEESRWLRNCAAPHWLGVWIVMAILLSIPSDGFGGEGDAARIEYAIAEYTEAMECQERARRLNLFARSEQLFRQIVDGDAQHKPIRNADLYVNLGSAALQAERVGPAIVAYRQALAMAPQHAQASQNLAYARSLVPDWARYDDPETPIDSLLFWRSMLNDGQLKIYAALSFLFGAALVALGIARRQTVWRNLAVVPLLAWALLLMSLFFDPDEAALHNAIVVQESRVYTADSANSPPRLSKLLPSGAELVPVQRREGWVELRLPDGRTGWVLSAAVQQLDVDS